MASLLAIALFVAACSTSGTAQPTERLTPTTAPGATLEPTVPPAASTTAPAVPRLCISSTPAQVGNDLTPVVVAIDGLSEAECAESLVVKADASDYTKAHPPIRLEAIPEGTPACVGTLQGHTYTVWGTSAAAVVCASLKK